MGITIENLVDELEEEKEQKFRVKFNKYAIEKYGCDEFELKRFYRHYTQALKYEKEREKKNVIKTASLAIGGAIGFLCFRNGQFATEDVRQALIYQGASWISVVIAVGAEILMLADILDTVPNYSIKRKNPYIKKGTIEFEIAKDYSKMKRMIRYKGI